MAIDLYSWWFSWNQHPEWLQRLWGDLAWKFAASDDPLHFQSTYPYIRSALLRQVCLVCFLVMFCLS